MIDEVDRLQSDSPLFEPAWVARPWRGKSHPVLRNHAFGKQGKQTSSILQEGIQRSSPFDLEEDVPQIEFLAKPYHANASRYAPHVLICGVMNYAWGNLGLSSAVAKWLHQGNPSYVVQSSPYAELWVGTHVSSPSRTQDGKLLLDFLAGNPGLLGQAHIAQFGYDLPHLLKILSVQKALSIQAHPAKAHAEQLHRDDPEHYPDPNHKPEAVVALTDYKALCSFRPLREIAHYLQTIAELAALFTADALRQFLAVATDDQSGEEAQKAVLKLLYTMLLQCPAAVTGPQLQALEARLCASACALDLAELTFLELLATYPEDPGCFQVFFLNIIVLRPGEGLFLAANEPHAYLRGDAVEVMARSDNVVRAGLTPKFKDARVLGEMLSYDTQEVHIFRPNVQGPFTSYCPPPEYPDFKLLRIHLTEEGGRDWACASYELLGSSACLLCVKGSADVLYCVKHCANAPASLTVRAGCAYFLPLHVLLYFSMKEEFVAFIAEAQL